MNTKAVFIYNPFPFYYSPKPPILSYPPILNWSNLSIYVMMGAIHLRGRNSMKFSHRIKYETGLHGRVAARIVDKCIEYNSDI